MMYQYNYSFLDQWLDANKDVKRQDVREALGVKSNNGLKSWVEGKGPMPVLNIIRFCNSFQVPIACFFRDIETGDICKFTPEQPHIKDQLEPIGGYDEEGGQRCRGQQNLEDPTKCSPRQSNIPVEYKDCTIIQSVNKFDDTDVPNKKQNMANELEPIIDSNALIILENKHCDERKKLLDIIIEQQKKIADLTKQIYMMKE